MSIVAKTIMLKGGTCPQEEALANAGTVLPGHLIYLMSTGNVAIHAVAGGNAEKMFAIEDELQGGGIDDLYTISTLVQYKIFQPGDWVNAVIANGQTIVIGDPLESAGAGTLQKHTPAASGAVVEAVNSIVAYAMAAVDMSGSSLVDPSPRCAVRIA